jgi:hypothetical protein
MGNPRVTIVVVPRDHFSDTRESLENIFAHTDMPFKLVYVDGGSPRHVRHYLQSMARIKKFNVIRTDHYLSPNHARNQDRGEVLINSKSCLIIVALIGLV